MCLTQKQTAVLLCCHMKPVPESSQRYICSTPLAITNLKLKRTDLLATIFEDKQVDLALKYLIIVKYLRF